MVRFSRVWRAVLCMGHPQVRWSVWLMTQHGGMPAQLQGDGEGVEALPLNWVECVPAAQDEGTWRKNCILLNVKAMAGRLLDLAAPPAPARLWGVHSQADVGAKPAEAVHKRRTDDGRNRNHHGAVA